MSDESPYSPSRSHIRENCCLGRRASEALVDSLEAQFKRINDTSELAVIDNVMRACCFVPAIEPELTYSSEFKDVIRCLKVWKAPGPNGIPERAVKHFLQSFVSLLTKVSNAIPRMQYFQPAWMHALLISMLRTGKDPTQPSFHRPIRKMFEKILFTKNLSEVSRRECLDDEQCVFTPKHRTGLQLARLIERVPRNFGGRKLTGAVFLEFAKTFDTVWVDGLFYKLTLHNSPSLP